MSLNLYRLGLLGLAMAALVSCKEETGKEPDPAPPTNDPNLVLSSGVLNAPGNYSTKVITVSSNRAWTAVVPEEAKAWVEVIPASSEGDKKGIKVTIKVLPNTLTPSNREIAVDFKLDSPDEAISKKFQVNQASDFYFLKDSLVVVQLYNELGGPNWTHPWDFSKPLIEWGHYNKYSDGSEKWDGVYMGKVDGARRVTSVWFWEKENLVGQLKGSTLASLTAMNSIRFNSPVMTCDMTELAEGLKNIKEMTHVILKNCTSIGGVLPKAFNALDSLGNFDVSGCSFTDIEDGFGDAELVGFTINDNKLTGPMRTAWISAARRLAIVEFKDNNITGEVPSDFIAGLPRLLQLGLSGNCLSGDFPETIRRSGVFTAEGAEPAIEICQQKSECGGGFTEGTCE